MFASRTTIFFAVFALSAKVLAGIPPACLLAAVNTQPDPADLKSICGPENSKKVEDEITSKCGNNVKAAMDAFSSTCKSAGMAVATPSVTGGSLSGIPTNSANGTFVYTTQFFNSSCSCTQTSVISSSHTPSLDTPVATSCLGGDCSGSGAGSGGAGASATGGSASSTGSGSAASSTGAATVVEQQGAFAAAAIALAGLVAVL